MTNLYRHVAGWLFDNEFRMLSYLAKDKKVLEIGCYQGRSTVAMAETAKSIVSVDYFHGDDYTASVGHVDTPEVRKQIMMAWVQNTAHAEEKCSLFMGDMYKILPLLDPNDFDLIFFDADHTREACQYFFNWIDEGEIKDDVVVTLHDYKPGQGPKWEEGVEVMDEWHARSKRLAKLVGSLITYTSKPFDDIPEEFKSDGRS